MTSMLMLRIGGLLVVSLRTCSHAWSPSHAGIPHRLLALDKNTPNDCRKHISRRRAVACFLSSSALDTPDKNAASSTPSSSSSGVWLANSTSADVYVPHHQQQHPYPNDTSTTRAAYDLTPIAFGSPPDAMQAKQDDADAAMILIDDTTLPLPQLALAGSLTTFLGDMLVHPMDCVKTLQQARGDLSLPAAVAHLWDTAGLGAFYHGFLTYAATDAVSGAIKFVVWEVWKQNVVGGSSSVEKNNYRNNDDDTKMLPLLLFLGAALAFVASSITLVPGEVLKQALQMEQYESLPAAVQGIYEHAGWAGFYTGYEAVLCRDVPYTMLELGLYELFKRFTVETSMTQKGPYNDKEAATTTATPSLEDGSDGASSSVSTPTTSSSASDEIFAAMVTGALAATLTNPSDAIKTKMMADPDLFAGASFLDCVATTVADHGPLSLFAGALARVAWLVPFTAVYLPTYDALKRWMWKRHVQHQQQQQQQQVQQSESSVVPTPTPRCNDGVSVAD